MKITLAVDAMGGDYGPTVTVPASLRSLKLFPELYLTLVGDVDLIQQHLRRAPVNLRSRIYIQSAVNDPDESRMSSFSAVRNAPDSPIGVGVDLVRSKQVDAFVSAGHTSFLMASSTYRLKRIPGLSRPAICSIIPNSRNESLSFLLDVGANLESDAENLYEFALMGSLLAKAVTANRQPRIALLNIGSEVVKGTHVIKDAATLIEHNPLLNYIGYVEGHDLFKGSADVIVCDGFSGNVALKASEGAAVFINEAMMSSMTSTLLRRAVSFLSYPLFADLKKRLDPQSFNGAVLLGVQGIIVKSHGHASIYGFSNAINHAMHIVRGKLLDSIRENFESSNI